MINGFRPTKWEDDTSWPIDSPQETVPGKLSIQSYQVFSYDSDFRRYKIKGDIVCERCTISDMVVEPL